MKGERQHTDFNEYDDTPVTCPRCGFTQIHAEKIAYGQFLSNKILISCLKCGHQFRLKKQPIPDRLSLHPLERTKGLYVTCPNCGKLSGTACYACPKCGRKFLQEDFDKARKIKGTGCFTVIVIGGWLFPCYLCNIKYNRMEENALLSHELERLKQPVRSAKKESLL